MKQTCNKQNKIYEWRNGWSPAPAGLAMSLAVWQNPSSSPTHQMTYGLGLQDPLVQPPVSSMTTFNPTKRPALFRSASPEEEGSQMLSVSP